MKQIWILLLGVAVASGCTWRDRANDYRQASLSKPLVLPQGISGSALHDSYRVPGIESHVVLPGEFAVPKPDPLVKDSDQGVVRVQKMGDDRWILLDGTPGQIWPRLRGFLNLGGFPVARTDAVNGLIETGWVQPKGDLPRERFRFRIDQGVQRGTSEIHVLQSVVENDQGQWSRGSFSEQREQAMTMALAQYLADSEAASSVSMLAERNVDAGGKIFLEGGSDPHIRLLLPYERAWASLANALEKSGFIIDDLNRSEGRYWVTIDTDADSSLWFRRLVKDEDVKGGSFIVDMRQVEGGEIQIRVTAKDKSESNAAILDRVLKQIKGFIS
ncbi:outer membrane protein assembly factor BamC [Litorivivens sp.]|uniref:outer membrane protein assembly factor BamC n=2 Tax=Litorivivens sp. TaxID=2020868 RepID=UPI003564FBFD